MKKRYALIFSICFFFASGCQMMMDSWPQNGSPTADSYVFDGNDPNTFKKPWPWKSIRSEAQKKQRVVAKHTKTILELEAEMKLDKNLYDLAIGELDYAAQYAKDDRDKTIGTPTNPSPWISLLLGATGLGIYYAGARAQRPEDATQISSLQNTIATFTDKNYTPDEVRALLDRQKKGENIVI